MNRVLETAFPTFSRHAAKRAYYTYPEVRRFIHESLACRFE